jgi:hypothetical protein
MFPSSPTTKIEILKSTLSSSLSLSKPQHYRQHHLIIFIHGYDGSSTDFTNFLQELQYQVANHHHNQTTQPEHPPIHTFSYLSLNIGSTYDGIEAGAIRAWRQIMQYIQNHQSNCATTSNNQISIIAHSLGGLYARYLLRLLSDSFIFDQYKPFMFMTFATPHLGIRRNQQTPFNIAFQNIAQRINKTTSELCLEDSATVPLLLTMTDSSFIEPLLGFQHRILYANVWNDIQIPYISATISLHNPYKLPANDFEILLSTQTTQQQLQSTTTQSPTFPSITMYSLQNFPLRLTSPPAPPTFCQSDVKSNKILSTIYERLRIIPFERYDVLFYTLFAHEQIINKRKWFAGKDVVQHACQRLLNEFFLSLL